MARANSTKVSKFNTAKNPEVVENLAGGAAFKYTPELELAIRCASNFMEDSYYASNSAIRDAIKDLAIKIGENNPEYVMKLAAWLRNDMNMRSISIFLLALMAGHPSYKGKEKLWLSKYGPYIMLRADESAEALASFKTIYEGEKIPTSLKRAINKRLVKLSDYEVIKYRGTSRAWSLKDVIRVTHPKTDDAAKNYLFNWVVNDKADVESANKVGLKALASYLTINSIEKFEDVNLESLDGATWELLTSKFGSTPEVWAAAAKVMPSFAYIRNLRNLLEKGKVELDYEKIVKAGKGKHILPFRFLTARNIIDNLGNEFSSEVQKAKKGLEEAIELATENVPNLGNIAILVDYSGSMRSRISSRSEMTYSDAARVFAAAAFKRADNAVIIEYDDEAHVVKGIEKEDRLFSIVGKLQRPQGGTTLPKALELVKPYLDNVDMVYILTDEQSWGRGWSGDDGATALGKLFGMKASLKVINHNLASYGTTELPEDTRILEIGGWSDQIFSVVDKWSKGGMVQSIKDWELDIREDD